MENVGQLFHVDVGTHLTNVGVEQSVCREIVEKSGKVPFESNVPQFGEVAWSLNEFPAAERREGYAFKISFGGQNLVYGEGDKGVVDFRQTTQVAVALKVALVGKADTEVTGLSSCSPCL